MRRFLTESDRLLLRLDLLLVGAAGVCIIAMMFLSSFDALLRYAFNAPIRWSFQLISDYLLPAAFWFGFSYTLRVNHHIAIDFFARWIALRHYHVLLALACVAAGVIFAYVAMTGAAEAYNAWINNEVIFGVVLWPTWAAKIIIPIGMIPLALRCFHRAAVHAIARNDNAFAASFGATRVDDLAAAGG